MLFNTNARKISKKMVKEHPEIKKDMKKYVKRANNNLILIVIIWLITGLCIGSIISNVSAITESVILEESNYTISDKLLPANVAGRTAALQLNIDYDKIDNPEILLWYMVRTTGNGNITSSNFIMHDGGKQIATGTVETLNGSFMSGSYNYYMLFRFNSWNNQGYTGIHNYVNISFDNVALNKSIPSPSQASIGPAIPMSIRASGEPAYPMSGYWIYNGFNYRSQYWEITNITPISRTMIFSYNITKNGISKPTIFSNSTVIYTGSQDKNSVSGTGIGSDLVVQMYNPSTYQKFNSSLLFKNFLSDIPVTPIPTITIDASKQAENPIAIIDGKSDGLIPNSQVSIYNHNLHVWSNTTASSGYFHHTANISDVLDIYGDAIGYEDNSITGFVWGADTPVNMILIPEIGGATGTDTSLVYVTVLDYDSNAPIEGALVVISNASAFTTQSGYTNSAGYLELTIGHDTTVYGVLTVSKSPAYYSTTMPVTITMNDKSAPVYLHRKTSVTPTYTIPTQSTTIAVTPTIQGWNGAQLNETSCYQPGHYPEGFGYWDVIRNGIACSGVKGQTNQNLAFALVIMMICALVLARYAKGIGALAGVIAGASFSFGMNILPLWILITVIIICGIIIAKMIMGSGGK